MGDIKRTGIVILIIQREGIITSASKPQSFKGHWDDMNDEEAKTAVYELLNRIIIEFYDYAKKDELAPKYVLGVVGKALIKLSGEQLT